jgi:hypothetical protein
MTFKLVSRELPRITYVAIPMSSPYAAFAHICLGDKWIGILYPTSKYEENVYTNLFTTECDLESGFSTTVAGFFLPTYSLDENLRALAALYPPF